ncbi:MAG: lipoyl protein ligase domain-containing protein [Planctomycetaceae bacterium]
MPHVGPHAAAAVPSAPRKPLAVWLAGVTGFGDYLAMAERLAGEVAEVGGRPPTLVLCEFEPVITIGRAGSRSDVRLSDDDLRERRLAVRFTGRGGGAVLHGPGQVVVAMFARLEDLGLAAHDVGGFVDRFVAAVAAAIATVRCGSGSVVPGFHGVVGRSGLLAAAGLAVRRGVVCHGAFINVSPALDVFHRVDTMPRRGRPDEADVPTTMGSIEADVQRRVRLQDVRTAVIESVAAAFAAPRMHVNAGFPFRIQSRPEQPEVVSRVG